MKKKFLGIIMGVAVAMSTSLFVSAETLPESDEAIAVCEEFIVSETEQNAGLEFSEEGTEQDAEILELEVAAEEKATEEKAEEKIQVAVNPQRSVVYDRENHGTTLLTVTNAADYTMYYSLEEELTKDNYTVAGKIGTPELVYAGEYDVYYYVTAAGYVPASGHVTYTIKKQNIRRTGAYLEYTTTEYNGEEKRPYVVIDKLTWSIDYKIEYIDNIEVTGDSYAKVKIMGINNYDGYMYKYFTITKGAQPVKVAQPRVNFEKNGTFTLNVVGAKGKILSYSSSDPNVATIDSKGKVTMLSKGVTTLTVKVGSTENYRSATKKVTLDLTKDTRYTQTVKVTDKNKPYSYNAKFNLGATAKTTLRYASSNKKVAIVSKSGVITMKGIGETTITVKAIATNKYQSATKKIKVTIRPKRNAFSVCSSTAKGKLKLVWGFDEEATGYEIQLATNKEFENAKKATAKATNTATTISNLTSGKTVYVRIRTYKKVGDVTYYAVWSPIKSVKVK